MDLLEIRESGLLELYVLGECSEKEIKTVERAILEFPELKKDLYQIGAALEQYARLHSITPSPGLKDQILEQVTSQDGSVSTSASKVSSPKRFNTGRWTGLLLGAALMIVGYLYYVTHQQKNISEQELEQYRIYCDSIQLVSDTQFAQLNQLQDDKNEILPLEPTEKYPETEVFLIYNPADEQNFVQVKNLPPISNQQSFQLWSLKANEDPIPLTVFQGDEGFFIPVDFESGTATYAITIEPFGGRQSPTLENLIGTVNVPA